MSLLPHDTFVNASRQLYADQGSGGGGGGGNTLTSPATITPEVDGDTSLTLTATGTGDANIDMTAVGPNANASVFIESQQAIASLGLLGGSAFGSVINMTGNQPGNTTVIKQTGAAPFPFEMSAAPAQVGQGPFLSYNPTAGTLGLGDGRPTGSVVVSQPLLVDAGVGGTSTVSIGGSATNSVLSLQAINLFASSAANRTMVINASADGSDPPLAGFDYTNDIITLGKALFGGTITMNSPVSITSPTIGQAKYQQTIGTVAAETPITITNPTADGLYSVMMTSSASDITSLRACIGTVAYWRNGYGWSAGGNMSTPLNALGNQYAQLLTGGGGGSLQFQTSAGVPTLNGMGCSVVQLTGTIPTF